MEWTPSSVVRWFFDSRNGPSDRFLSRWISLRALGAIYFSAFFSLVFQIRGLIGPEGILPAGEYLKSVAEQVGHARYWYVPSILWFSSGSHMLTGLCWVGMAAAVLLVFNIWPRAMLAICSVCFLSFVSAAGDFSGYQSDGMLLEAGFLSLFIAPPGFRPGLGETRRPIRAALYLLLWEWFRIYFESGVAKIVGGDPEWRNFTAMDDYYQNGPLPTWIGWYVQHLPHWFHASTVLYTLVVELLIVWMLFLPRRFRIVCFFIVTPFEISIIATANYTFLNYLVLLLGVLLLDDRFLEWILPLRFRELIRGKSAVAAAGATGLAAVAPERASFRAEMRERFTPLRRLFAGACLGLVFYSTTALLLWMFMPGLPLPEAPVRALEPFRIANSYGLFAVMTHERYE